MPTICIFYGIVITMYYNDHSPPHFHAKYVGFEGIIDIQKLQLIEGELPRRALGLVLDWAELHQSELLKDWDLCRQKQMPNKIEPLK